MADLIVTGASRGIGLALVNRLAKDTDHRLVLVARDSAKLDALAAQVRHRHKQVLHYPCDLSVLASATALGEKLAGVLEPGAILVHNAGIWPTEKDLTVEGYERAYATNCLGPLAFQKPLLGKLARVLVVGAGLMTKGRFDDVRTPRGDDFSALRTYASTKLAFAVAMRDVAAAHPALDVLVVHPGVVRTDLGAREGMLGSVLSLVKRSFETPQVCAERLLRILARPHWSEGGQACWQVEEVAQPWPALADDAKLRAAVRRATQAVA